MENRLGKRSDFTDEQITAALNSVGGNCTEAARILNEEYEPESKVTRQNVEYWAQHLNEETMDLVTTATLARDKRTLQVSNNRERKIARDLVAALGTKDEFLMGMSQAVRETALAAPLWPNTPVKKSGGKPITIELLFSDLQIGKLMDDYDSLVAHQRVEEYISVVIDRIWRYIDQGYVVEKIVFAVLGDIIESDKKHSNSARATDTGTAEQIRASMETLVYVINQLTQVSCPIDVVMITGNHDHDDHGLNMFMPGREHLSWPLYKGVEMVLNAQGFGDYVKFFIPEGSFHVHQIYDHKVLYEHGVGVAASQAGMSKHLASRMAQRKDFITFFRMGDKHNVCRFNNDTLVVNGAFFGDSRNGEEYSGIAGYDGYPAQLMFAHVKREDDSRTSLFDSLAIQLGHIT